MEQSYGYKAKYVRDNVLANRHNHITTTYYLLVKSNMRAGKNSISDLISNEYLNYIRDKSNLKLSSNYPYNIQKIALVNKTNFRKIIYQKNTTGNNIQSGDYLMCDHQNSHKSFEDKNDSKFAESNDEAILDYKDFFHVNCENEVISKVNAKPEKCIKDSIKEQYERYIKTNKYKLRNFKNGFLNTSTIYEQQMKKIKNKTFNIGITNNNRSPSTESKAVKNKIKIKKFLLNNKEKITHKFTMNSSCPEINPKENNSKKKNTIYSKVSNYKITNNQKLKNILSKSMDCFRSDRSHSTNSTRPKGSTNKYASIEPSKKEKLSNIQNFKANIPTKLKTNINIVNYKSTLRRKSLEVGSHNIAKMSQFQVTPLRISILNNKIKQGQFSVYPKIFPKSARKREGQSLSISSISFDDIEVHDGPIDICMITNRQPTELINDICATLYKLKLTYKQVKVYSLITIGKEI
jgi:hypothetical protein